MGISHGRIPFLASIDMAVFDVGCGVVWEGRQRAAFHESVVAHRQHLIDVPGFSPAD